METREILKQIKDTGFPISVLARAVNKDPSTIQKWIMGTNKYLKEETEMALRNEIKKLKEFWINLDI